MLPLQINSYFVEKIDNIAYFALILVLLSGLFLDSGAIGLFALLFCFLIFLKLIFKKTNYKIENYEKALIIYFLLVTLSLFGSTLFSLSLHGYLKTLTYILFYFSAAVFFADNRNKIFPTFLIVASFMSFESIIAIIQNHMGVAEISGWQDVSNMNPEDVIARAYGTLKPYNPNLLAGYLLCGLSSFIYLAYDAFQKNKKIYSIGFLILFLINLIAIIYTGCRGAYLGFLLFFPVLFLAIFKKLNKKYKNISLAGVIAFLCFVFTNPAIVKRFQSILSFRADSSISFRLNVYESVWRMFLDNIILGIGVGNQNFREIYGLYMKTGYDALGAYCVPLEIAVESGIFALIAFIVFLVLVFIKCLKGKSTLAFAVILMLLAVFGHGFFPYLKNTVWNNHCFDPPS